ncbi:bifunctional precorrin-2 dehydrogenase/sirohydrochlorin ferrochelatase [Methanolapillus millepedarum]|uniref:precorrin-2 dehydrogenase n=1 Tax=Methanolapillus millepedarum TaxID=3028296 RepID=A0AA96V2R8_9EURY|nr:Siroheme synthase [Methanosarcinaceae archaeon Ac7]
MKKNPNTGAEQQDFSSASGDFSNISSDNSYLPLFIDFSEKPVLIFGGGAVGERKVERFIHAPLQVVSLKFTEKISEYAKAGRIQVLEKDVSEISDADLKKMMDGVFLVIVATPDEQQNNRIEQMAKSAGILVNHTGGAEEVIIPSLIDRNGLQIAISSGGESPAVTKYARLQIEKAIGSDFEKMIEIQNDVRNLLKNRVPDQKKRQEILWEIMDSGDIWDLLKSENASDFEKAKEKAFMMAGIQK